LHLRPIVARHHLPVFMKRIILLRHAKAEPADGPTPDRERVLTARGRDDAARMARFMRTSDVSPDLVLCSTAMRTRETLALVSPVACPRATTAFRDDLYLADAADILDMLRGLDASVHAVLVVGHNPGMADLALMLCATPADARHRAAYQRMREAFPTAALAVIDVDVDSWDNVRAGAGALTHFIRPRDLREIDG
jgi:phosphohistidine phosphatase